MYLKVWPVIKAIYLLYFAICWKLEFVKNTLLSTLGIRDYMSRYNPFRVINWIMATGNQQVTNGVGTNGRSVGTSETTREKSSKVSEDDKKYNQWLAGLIDGDGSLLISKAGYPSVEITMGLADESALMRIKNKFGGAVARRGSIRALRYRLCNTPGVKVLLNSINGEIRNTVRVVQMKAMCTKYGITYIEPAPLTINNSWFMGFYDADGCATGSWQKLSPQLTISASNKYERNLTEFQRVLGGNIYYSKGLHGHYIWQIQSRLDTEVFLKYEKEHPCRSHKKQRLLLVNAYFELKAMKAHLAEEGTAQHQAWLNFCNKWDQKED